MDEKKFELTLYNFENNLLGKLQFDDYQTAINAGYSKLRADGARCFHIFSRNESGTFDKLPNGSTMFVGHLIDTQKH